MVCLTIWSFCKADGDRVRWRTFNEWRSGCVKGIGAVLIWLVGIGIGLLARQSLQRRCRVLMLTERLLQRMAVQIRFTAAPMDDVLRELADTDEFGRLPLLAEIVGRIPPNGDVRGAWQSALHDCGIEWGLSAEERALLCDFGDGLGTADIVGEVTRCEQYAERLHVCAKTAQQETARRGRLYTALGFCGGSAVALILL